MAKKVVGFVKLQVPAGSANPSPPIGPALGQRGLNIMEFCKAFNAKTQDQEKGMPIPVTITVFSDKSFTFEMKTPPASYFLKKAAKLSSGSKAPGITMAGSVTRAQVREILGSPLLTDIFHSDRWDWVFSIRRQGVPDQERRVTAWFDGDRLKKIEAPELPSEEEFVAAIDARKLPEKKPVLALTPEQIAALAHSHTGRYLAKLL